MGPGLHRSSSRAGAPTPGLLCPAASGRGGVAAAQAHRRAGRRKCAPAVSRAAPKVARSHRGGLRLGSRAAQPLFLRGGARSAGERLGVRARAGGWSGRSRGRADGRNTAARSVGSAHHRASPQMDQTARRRHPHGEPTTLPRHFAHARTAPRRAPSVAPSERARPCLARNWVWQCRAFARCAARRPADSRFPLVCRCRWGIVVLTRMPRSCSALRAWWSERPVLDRTPGPHRVFAARRSHRTRIRAELGASGVILWGQTWSCVIARAHAPTVDILVTCSCNA